MLNNVVIEFQQNMKQKISKIIVDFINTLKDKNVESFSYKNHMI